MDAATLAANLDDPWWRINNLYKIVTKGDDGEEDLTVDFKANAAQRKLGRSLWYRNCVLKVRQRGITTFICILWLDTALFSKSPIKCGILAQNREKAEEIFRDKVKFAYDNLPEELRERFQLIKDSGSELQFKHNGALVRVGTALRSGTYHRLLISEYGKICAEDPAKAHEVKTGSIPTVPKTGMLVIEATAEGQDGHFYEICTRAMEMQQKRSDLTVKDYRFHFFPWWDAPEYEIDVGEDFRFKEADLLYFQRVHARIGRELSLEKWAWWVTTRDADFAGEDPVMWQEYPSFPEEAFQVSTEGCYYANQLAQARLQGRILPSLPVERTPVNTFWDIGRNDEMCVWFHQRVGVQNRFIGYYEASGEDLSHYVAELQRRGFVYGTHYLPHDADHRRLGATPDTNRTVKEMLQDQLPGQRVEVVPRVTAIAAGIQATRGVFASCWFDETLCAVGLKRLANYRKQWDKIRGRWRDEPLHDANSNGADAFRQFGQEAEAGNVFHHGMKTGGGGVGMRRRRSGMAV